MVDGMAEGLVHSGTVKNWPFHQLDDDFAYMRWRGTPTGCFSGSASNPSPLLTDAKTGRTARPPHNDDKIKLIEEKETN